MSGIGAERVKTIDNSWQTSTSNNTKLNVTTKANKNTKINSISLHDSYDVLCIDENDFVENENNDTKERTIMSECNNEKTHKGTNTRFVNKVSGEWFFHSDEINQNTTVVPVNRSCASATKYGRKVIVFGDVGTLVVLTEKYLVDYLQVFSNSLTKCRTCLKYYSGARTKDLQYYVTSTLNEEKPDLVNIHIGSNDIDFRQLRHKTVENSGKDIINIDQKCRES